MKTKLLTLLTLLLTCVTGAWATDWTISIVTEGDGVILQQDGSYKYEFAEVKLNTYKNGLIYVEVPTATVQGTVSWKANGTNASRFLYIYKNNGTEIDETRSFAYASDWATVNYTSADILTNGGKYYLVFNTQHDWKATGVKYTATESTPTAPEFSQQADDVEVTGLGGNTVSFTVSASGFPTPSYQWYTCDADGNNAVEIPTATSSTYSFASPAYDSDVTNVYYYKAKASNSSGDAYSDVVSLTVNKKFACYAYLTETAELFNAANCTLKFYGTEGNPGTVGKTTQSGNYYQAKMNNNANYYEFSVAGGFKVGDKINLYLYPNGSTIGYIISKENHDAEPQVTVSKTVTSGKVYAEEITLTATDIESDGSVRIYRNSSNTYFAGMSAENLTTNLTISANSQYATFVTKRPVDMTKANTEGIKAYIVTGKGESSITTQEVTEVPANTAILLKAASEGVAAVTVAVDDILSATLPSPNKLKYSDTPVAGDGSTIYGFFKIGDEYGFAPVADGTNLAAGKAYLQIEGGELQARFYALDLEGETTAINALSTDQAKKNGVRKVLNNGRLIIEKDDVQYSIAGTVLK